MISSRQALLAIWDGIVMGGGVGLSVHAGFRVVTESTKFAMPETGLASRPETDSYGL